MRPRGCGKHGGTASTHCRNKDQRPMTEIRKREGIKVIIQDLRHVVIHPKAFLILHHPFEISRLSSMAGLGIISMF